MILGVFYLRQAGPNALPIQRRSTSACAIVPRSTYSSSLPTGTPRASRVTCTPALEGLAQHMRRGLTLGIEVGGQNHLLHHAIAGALHQLVQANLFRANAIERLSRPISTK